MNPLNFASFGIAGIALSLGSAHDFSKGKFGNGLTKLACSLSSLNFAAAGESQDIKENLNFVGVVGASISTIASGIFDVYTNPNQNLLKRGAQILVGAAIMGAAKHIGPSSTYLASHFATTALLGAYSVKNGIRNICQKHFLKGLAQTVLGTTFVAGSILGAYSLIPSRSSSSFGQEEFYSNNTLPFESLSEEKSFSSELFQEPFCNATFRGEPLEHNHSFSAPEIPLLKSIVKADPEMPPAPYCRMEEFKFFRNETAEHDLGNGTCFDPKMALSTGECKARNIFITTFQDQENCEETLQNHREYAEKWGYEHKIVDLGDKITHLRRLCEKNDQRELGSENWHLYLDADAVVTNMQVDPHQAIDKLTDLHDSSLIIGPEGEQALLFRSDDAGCETISRLSANADPFSLIKRIDPNKNPIGFHTISRDGCLRLPVEESDCAVGRACPDDQLTPPFDIADFDRDVNPEIMAQLGDWIVSTNGYPAKGQICGEEVIRDVKVLKIKELLKWAEGSR